LKKRDRTKTEAFKFGNNLAQPEPKEPSPKILKCQNRTGGSLKKEEPRNSGHSLPTHYSKLFFFGNFLGERNASKFPFAFVFFFGASKFPHYCFLFFSGFQIPLFYFILCLALNFPFLLPLFLASKFHYWFFILFGFQISLFLFLAFKFP